jgi:L-asparaginase II
MPSATRLVRVERGGVEEAVHAGHVVAVDAKGHVRFSLGDPEHLTYFRSCAKPFQAIASVRTGIVASFDLTPEHLAIMAASHNGEPRHLEVVRDLLTRAGVTESALQCGAHWPYYEPAAAEARHELDQPLVVFNNCSGKHAGMLAGARQLKAPLETYLDMGHPVQQRILGVVGEFTGCPPSAIRVGIDGCSAPNHAVPLASMARSFATLVSDEDDAAIAVVGAMTTNPYLVGGTDRFDTAVMEATSGRLLAKGGAAGAHCTADRRSRAGLALKLESGDGSWTPVAVVAALERLGWLEPREREALERFARPTLRNVRKLAVGTVRPAGALLEEP